jgi:hypothetical protein
MRLQLTWFLLTTTMATTPLANAFMPNLYQQQNPVGRPDLAQLTDQQTDAEWEFPIVLDIGKDDETHLAIQGMVLELHHEAVDDINNNNKVKRVLLPGSDGPHAQISSGPRRLDVLSEGAYVDIATGTRHVHTISPCWEMVWVQDKPAGSLICGFEIPQDYQRNANAATLPQGDLFLSFSLWTQAGLLSAQAEKSRIQKAQDQVEVERDTHLWKRDTTNNPCSRSFMGTMPFWPRTSSTISYPSRRVSSRFLIFWNKSSNSKTICFS